MYTHRLVYIVLHHFNEMMLSSLFSEHYSPVRYYEECTSNYEEKKTHTERRRDGKIKEKYNDQVY